MTSQVAVRLTDEEVATLDELVDSGVAPNRSDILRLALSQLADRRRRQAVADAIVASYREQPPTNEESEWAVANARRMVEAEPW